MILDASTLQNIRFPDKLHALVREALTDVQEAYKSPKCIVDMDYWASQEEDGVCRACFAGHYLLGKGLGPQSVHYISGGIIRMNQVVHIHHVAALLNQLRQGNFALCYSHWAKYLSIIGEKTVAESVIRSAIKDIDQIPYARYTFQHPEPFFEYIEAVANILERYGV